MPRFSCLFQRKNCSGHQFKICVKWLVVEFKAVPDGTWRAAYKYYGSKEEFTWDLVRLAAIRTVAFPCHPSHSAPWQRSRNTGRWWWQPAGCQSPSQWHLREARKGWLSESWLNSALLWNDSHDDYWWHANYQAIIKGNESKMKVHKSCPHPP